MDNLKIYQICNHLITYFATLIFQKKSQLVLYLRPEVVCTKLKGQNYTPSIPKYRTYLPNLRRLRITVKLVYFKCPSFKFK